MKSLIIVSAAVGIISGTSNSALAQTSINLQKLSSANTEKKQFKFIDGIETKQELVPILQSLTVKTDVVRIPVSSVKLPSSKAVVSKSAEEFSIEECTPIQFKYAQLMNATVESVTNIKLLEFIDEWWATRYNYGGTTKRGIDCSALTGRLLKDVYAQTVPRTAREQYHATERVSRNELEEGDLVFFNTRGGISHVGVYLGHDSFLHSSVSHGVTISSLNETYYSSKYIGGGRFKEGVTDNADEEVIQTGSTYHFNKNK